LDAGKYGAGGVLRVIRLIAEATAASGMIGGQVIDLESEGQNIPLARLQKLHRMKTGALIRASVTAPAVLKNCDAEILNRLTVYGDSVGLAFQIADDILDIEGGAEIGKDIGSDTQKGKSTYPALLGMDGAKREKARVMAAALDALAGFSDKADPLRELARFIVERRK
jgi:geranylgeranyl diphosphate synthase type II